MVLLVALAIDYLIRSWYRLFPRNPYARVFGLLPLGVLVTGLVVSSVDRYIYGLHYDKAVYDSHSYDLPILSKELGSFKSTDEVVLIVSEDNSDFYQSFARHQDYVKRLTVTTDTNLAKTARIAIVEKEAKDTIELLPSDILVTRTKTDADRFYLYKNS
jgi:hypothetical protein